MLIRDFKKVRKETADSLLSKIREYRPDFVLKERDRIDFVDFTFRSSRGLRHAKLLTQIIGITSLALSGLSSVALCWSALDPHKFITTRLFLAFAGLTLLGGPMLYLALNWSLKKLYSVNVLYGTNEENEALLFADCVDLYLKHKKQWDRWEESANELAWARWKLRLRSMQVNLLEPWLWIRSKFLDIRLWVQIHVPINVCRR